MIKSRIIELTCNHRSKKELSKSTKTIIPIIVVGIILAAGIIGGVTVLQQRGILPGMRTNTLSGSSGKGNLILSLHDPPNVPKGVSAVYVSYSGLSIRMAGEGDSSGWINLNQSGQVDLLSLVNFTETIANVKIQDGSFDLLRMNISSALVTFNSVNYTASISGSQMIIGIKGDIELNQTEATIGAVVDISPTVIMSDSQSTPSFALISSASAYVVPKDSLNQSQEVGDHQSIDSQTWLSSDEEQYRQDNLTISAAALSNSSLSVTVKNNANEPRIIQTIFVSSNVSRDDILSTGRSMIFSVLANGSLVPLGNERDVLLRADVAFGYNISAGASTTFTFTGSLNPWHYIINSETTATTTISGDHSASESNSSSTGDHSMTTNSSSGILPARLETVVTTSTTTETTHSESVTSTSSFSSGDSGSTTLSTESHSETSQTTTSDDWSSVQVVSGQTYLVGIVSGDSITYTSVVAS